MTRATHVIVGGGLAAARAAKAMRDKAFDGRIVIVAAEPHPPYDRPPLSKAVLLGNAPLESTRLLPPEFFREKEIELRLGTAAQSIDRAARRVHLSGGDSVPYDKLLLATGARARRLAMPGSDLAGIFYLRGLDDCAALGAALRADAAVTIVGGGYIGLEVAASACRRGCRVTVLEAQRSVMARIAAPEMAAWFEDLHRANGVDVLTGVTIAGFGGAGGRVDHVLLADGRRVAADVVVIGVGAVPNVELAAEAGLAAENGIVVDDQGRTADPDIFAAGDVTSHPNALLGRRVRLESWQNAQNQAIVAAGAMCGADARYAEIPWFWSDQYDVNLQIVGLPDAWDRVVVRRYDKERSLAFVYVKDGRVVSGNALNAPRDIPVLRQLIQTRHQVDPAALADAGRPLRELLPRRSAS
jgi:3-phenylpropionate/trans-cinnamate dioxygenase ferredoxin reductase subunit